MKINYIKKKLTDLRTYFGNHWVGISLIILCFVSLLSIRLYVDRFNTGDEPHYLLMAYSLEHDHDLNLRNNFENKDYYQFYPADINPQGQIPDKQLETNSPKWYSIHSIGLPILLLPAMLVAGKLGATVFMTMIATATVVLTYYWVKHTVNNKRIAMLTAAILVSCFFFNTLVGYLYPDMLIACLGLACLLILAKRYQSKVYQCIFGAILGFLVLLHFKTLLFAAPFFAVLAFKLWREHKKLPWFVILGGTPFAIYFMFTLYQWFGTFNPADIYAGLSMNEDTSPPAILSALLFDGNRGLLVFNPILLLLLVGLPLWFKYKRETLATVAVVTVPYMLILVDFWGWFGGDAPAGRYLMDFLPWFMPPPATYLVGLTT